MKKLLSIFLSLALLFAAGTEALSLTALEAASLDLKTQSGLSAAALEAGLKKDLAEFAEDFIAAEEKYGVNAVFLAALAAFESGWGRHCFLENNMFGWGGKSFETKSEGIDFVASKIAEHYLSEDGKYYHGTDLYGVNRSYNGSKLWVENVAAIMAEISERALCPEDDAEQGEEQSAEAPGGVIIIGAH